MIDESITLKLTESWLNFYFAAVTLTSKVELNHRD
jgi:hypothetical protein